MTCQVAAAPHQSATHERPPCHCTSKVWPVHDYTKNKIHHTITNKQTSRGKATPPLTLSQFSFPLRFSRIFSGSVWEFGSFFIFGVFFEVFPKLKHKQTLWPHQVSARKMLALGSRVAAGTGFLGDSAECEKNAGGKKGTIYDTERMLNINSQYVKYYMWRSTVTFYRSGWCNIPKVQSFLCIRWGKPAFKQHI